jgi:hypothetical protein
MKTTASQIIISILILFSLTNCSSNKAKKGDYLPLLKTEIPASLKDNEEAKKFIEESTSVLNQWSVTFEDLVVECEPFVGKDESELSTMDKLKLGKIMMEFVANMGQFAVKMAEMEQFATSIEDGLDEDEMQAMAAVMDAFEIRIQEINTKYKDFGKEQDVN